MNEEEIIEERMIKANGELSIQRYKKGKMLGKGGFATCYSITNLESNKKSALKLIPKVLLLKDRVKQKLMSEIKIHRSLNHPNIVKFEHFFEDPQNVYIILELCSNLSLKELLKQRNRLTEIEVKNYILQIITGIEHLHSLSIIHRDLKLGNIFIDHQMQIKLGDLGLATKVEIGELKRTLCGTPNYIAPEIIDGKNGHSYEVDIWAIGVIMYTMLVGKPPFQTGDLRSTYRRIRMCAYVYPENIYISNDAKHLISCILVADTAKRYTLKQVKQHRFFSESEESIPRLLPTFTLRREPTSSCLKKLYSEEWVKKWVDYSSKYGLGYLMSNGSTGTHFNDGSKMILNTNGHSFKYLKMKSNEEVEILYQLEDYPKKLHKKVVLLQHFRSYLDYNINDVTDNSPAESFSPHVKRWLRTKHAIIFRLSNRVVQVSFQDNSELLICSDSYTLIFVDKNGVKKRYQIDTVKEPQVVKRLKYTKEVLSKVNNQS